MKVHGVDIPSGHHIVKCSCGAMIAQCRCAGRDKPTYRIENGCKKCQNRLIEKMMSAEAKAAL